MAWTARRDLGRQTERGVLFRTVASRPLAVRFLSRGDMLHEFVTANRDEIIGRCRTKVLARSGVAAKQGSNHGVPMFLDQLVDELRVGLSSSSAIGTAAVQHGRDLLHQGYTVSQVVHDYGDVCQAITEMAVERRASITPDDFRMLNRCL